MKTFLRLFLIAAVIAALAACVPAFFPSLIWSDPEPASTAEGETAKPDPERGGYIMRMAGCASCHTDKGGKVLAGGHKLKTPFGTFTVPNITPDRATGIGGWTEADFVRAMTLGLSPDGRHYYPSFPYTNYARMTRADLRDLWAYLKTVEPVNQSTAAHELDFPYSVRPGLGLWKLLYLDTSPFQPNESKSKAWNRGAYIVTGPSHCGACHTPRNMLGGPIASRFLQGTSSGPEGGAVPNITPHGDKNIAKWSQQDLTFALQTGVTPSGDVLGGTMAPVVENTTSKLSEEDRAAIAEYLKSLPAGD